MAETRVTSCPPDCGACCDPVVLPYTREEVLRAPWLLDPADRAFVIDALTPVRRRDGLRRASYLSAGVTVMGRPGSPESTVLAWSFFYDCRHFDPETRRCTNYDNRPPLCRDFPWYGDPPDPSKALPTECAYRADL